MAYLPQDDKQQQQNQNQLHQAQGLDTGAGSAGAGGGGGGGSSSAASSSATAGYGAGGSGGWTNIQQYLNANAGNTGSSQALKNQVGGAFNKESQNIAEQSSQAKAQADTAKSQSDVGTNKAYDLVQQATQNYGTQNPAYSQATGTLKTALNAKAPASFNYGIGADAQNYGTAIGTDQGFNGLMQGLYSKSGLNQMGSGGMALQNQLDTNNRALSDTRNALISQYAGLGDQVSNTVADTSKYLGDAGAQVKANQDQLNSYLGGLATQDKGAVDRQVGNWNALLDRMESYGGGKNPYVDSMIRPQISASSVGGVGNERNQWNAIQEIMGTGNKIESGSTINPNAIKMGQMGTLTDWISGYAESDPGVRDIANALGIKLTNKPNFGPTKPTPAGATPGTVSTQVPVAQQTRGPKVTIGGVKRGGSR